MTNLKDAVKAVLSDATKYQRVYYGDFSMGQLRTALAAIPETVDQLHKFLDDLVTEHGGIDAVTTNTGTFLMFAAARLAESGVTVPENWQFKYDCVIKALDQLRHVQGCTEEQHKNLGNAIWNLWQSLGVMEPDGWRDEPNLSKFTTPPPPKTCRWVWHKDEMVSYWQIGCIPPSAYGCAAYAFPQHLSFESFRYCPYCGAQIEEAPNARRRWCRNLGHTHRAGRDPAVWQAERRSGMSDLPKCPLCGADVNAYEGIKRDPVRIHCSGKFMHSLFIESFDEYRTLCRQVAAGREKEKKS